MAIALFVVGFAVGASAQTVAKQDTFTFAGSTSNNPRQTQPSCWPITAWDDVPNAYPQNMGAVCLVNAPGDGYGSSIEVPFQLGYLNNGQLDPCNLLAMQPKVFTKGDGTHDGDTYTQSGATTCPYFTGEYGTYLNSNNRLEGFSVTVNYEVLSYVVYFRGTRHTYFTNVVRGGSGTVTDTLIN